MTTDSLQLDPLQCRISQHCLSLTHELRSTYQCNQITRLNIEYSDGKDLQPMETFSVTLSKHNAAHYYDVNMIYISTTSRKKLTKQFNRSDTFGSHSFAGYNKQSTSVHKLSYCYNNIEKTY